MSKFKAIVLILLASFIGIFSNPEMLAASDSVNVAGINNIGIVETVIKKEPEAVAHAGQSVATPDYTFMTPAVPVPASTPAPGPVSYIPANYIEINGDYIPLEDTSVTDSDAGYYTKQAWYYTVTGRYIYGHNSQLTFGGLYNLSENSTFTVSRGGEVSVYKVKKIVIYDKIDMYYLRDPKTGKNVTMYPITNPYYDGVDYDMALLTCYGINDSQRFVVFAEKQ